MSLSISTGIYQSSDYAADKSPAMSYQEHRIKAALGSEGNRILKVNDETIFRYYEYLKTHLSFPFPACYPEPINTQETSRHFCIVLELLDPNKYIGDEFDGIFCKTRKGKYVINLPLIDLDVPPDSPNFQLIDDFWYWFWNWR
jgi:hypothetical protein